MTPSLAGLVCLWLMHRAWHRAGPRYPERGDGGRRNRTIFDGHQASPAPSGLSLSLPLGLFLFSLDSATYLRQDEAARKQNKNFFFSSGWKILYSSCSSCFAPGLPFYPRAVLGDDIQPNQRRLASSIQQSAKQSPPCVVSLRTQIDILGRLGRVIPVQRILAHSPEHFLRSTALTTQGMHTIALLYPTLHCTSALAVAPVRPREPHSTPSSPTLPKSSSYPIRSYTCHGEQKDTVTA